MAVLDPRAFDTCLAEWAKDSFDLLAALAQPDADPNPVDRVEHLETHISDVFLAGEFAYKLKKPIKTDFLDYSTLEKRHHFCLEELRLDRRYAGDLYIDVVPITIVGNRLCVEGHGDPIEYAVKMHRFSDRDLLSVRVDEGMLSHAEVDELAGAIAAFHEMAERRDTAEAMKVPAKLSVNMQQICEALSAKLTGQPASTLNGVRTWSDT